MSFNASLILNDKLNVALGQSKKITNINFLYSHKESTPTGLLVNPNWAKKGIYGENIGDPISVSFTEFSLADYENVSKGLNSSPMIYSTITSGSYAYALFKFAFQEMAVRSIGISTQNTLEDLKNRFINLLVTVNAFGVGVNNGTVSNGLNLYIYNIVTQSWELVALNNANSLDNISSKITFFTGNMINNYLADADGSLYFMLRPQYPSDGTLPSSLTISMVKGKSALLGQEIVVGTQVFGSYANASLETNATSTEQTTTLNVETVSVLKNDGTDDIQFNFDSNIGDNGTITLKPGESLNDFPIKCYNLYYKANSGVQPFRAWGVR